MTRANDMCIVSTRWKTLASLESMIHFYFDEYETCLNIRPTNLHCCSSNENLPLIFSKRLKSARTSTKPQLSESLLTELQTICGAWQWIKLNVIWLVEKFFPECDLSQRALLRKRPRGKVIQETSRLEQIF